MRSGRPSWTDTCPAATLESIRTELLSRARKPAELFLAYNVRQWGASARTFRAWCTRERKLHKAKTRIESGELPAGAAPGPRELSAAARRSLLAALESNTLPLSVLPGAMRAIAELDELAMKQDAAAREAERHEWKRADRQTQAEVLDDVSKTAQLTPEQVAEIRLKVLGL